ncbi:MAG: type II secretion system F family protein [Ectothiorhodospiraceae bacterium]|nr:type II secretion system F family protein [Chromatiales bacterium]MCP5155038.1 type II secretion system F family protein [Ectothiorhodospiraceae bacterium]
MPLFRYRARGTRGDLLEGQLDAASADSVAAELLNGGVTPIDIREIQGPAPRPEWLVTLERALRERPPRVAELILFARQMYTLLRAGVPIVRGMRSIRDSTRGARMATVLGDIGTDLETGRELSSALSRYPTVFSSLFVSMVRVGENTGRLDEAFLRIAQYLELDKETRDRVKAAMRYPTFVIVAISVAIGIINVMVIPAFAQVFERSNVDLPWATQVLIATSHFFEHHWPALLGAVVAGWLGLMRYVRTETGRYRWDKLKLRLPVVGDIIHRATLGRFARAMSICLRSGVPIVQALTVVARALDNEFVADRVGQMRNGIERGDTLTRTAAGTGLFTPLVLQMLAIGDESGAVDDLLEEVASFYEREVDAEIKNLSAAIEPILIIGVGILVLVLAMGVFLPMWDLATGMGLR